MTQQKKATKKQKPQINLREKYLALSNDDQVKITHFFNLHNAAHTMYDDLSDAGKTYVSYCIDMSMKADKIETKNSAQVPLT